MPAENGMQGFLKSTWGKYLIALLAVAAALALRALMVPWLGRGGATITLYGAIAVAVWFGGYKPGLLAAIFGYLCVMYVFRSGDAHFDAAEAVRFAGFLISATLIVALGGAMHSARRRAEADADDARRRALDLADEVKGHRETRANLEAKERDLQIVTDTMTAAVARCSADFRYLWVNRLYAEWAGNGLKPEQLIGRPMADILGVQAMERIRPHAKEVLSGRRVEYQRYARRPVGQRWITVSMEPTFDAAGVPDGWVSVIHDIDETKRATEALREVREQLQVVTDNLPAAVIRYGNDLRLLWINPIYERWLRKPARQLIGKTMADTIGPEQMREVAPYVARVLKGEAVEYERVADLPGLGGKRWISVVLSPVLDANGDPEGWVSIIHDIHDRKLAEETLRGAEKKAP